MFSKGRAGRSQYGWSFACEKLLQNMNIQFWVNHPNPLFQCGWLKNLQATSLVCQILASKFTDQCTSENQSNRQCNDCRPETYWRQIQIPLARTTRLSSIGWLYANLPFVIWSVHSFSQSFIWSLTWKAAGLVQSSFFLIQSLGTFWLSKQSSVQISNRKKKMCTLNGGMQCAS